MQGNSYKFILVFLFLLITMSFVFAHNININFYDENSLSAIPEVTITDANGSTYTSDVNGLWTTDLVGAKSFEISKIGYATRPFEFYFNADSNYNLLLNPTGLDSNIGFIVKDTNDNLWNNKYLMFAKKDFNITEIIGDTNADEVVNSDTQNYILFKTFDYTDNLYPLISKVTNQIRRYAGTATQSVMVRYTYNDDTNLEVVNTTSTSTYATKTYTNTNASKPVKKIEIYLNYRAQEKDTIVYFTGYGGPFIINSLLTSSSGTGVAYLPITSFVNGDYNALLYDATGTYVEPATLIPYLLKLNFNTDTNSTLANMNTIIEFNDVTNLIYSSNALPLNSNILITFNKGFQFYEFYNIGNYLIDANIQLFDLDNIDQNQLDKVYIGTRNKFAIIVPDAQITIYKQKTGTSEWITIGQKITDDAGLNYIYTNENDLIKIIATKDGYNIGSRIVSANEFWGSYTNILWVTINETENTKTNNRFNTYLNYNKIDPITQKRMYNADINGIYATITSNLSGWLRLEIYEEGILIDALNNQGYYNYLDVNIETPNDYNFLYYAMNTDMDYELIDHIELIYDVNATSPFEDRDLLYREDLQEANTTNKTRTLVLILILICLSALATMIKAELLVFFAGAMIFSLIDINFLLVGIVGLIYIVFNQYIKKLLYDN